MSSVLETLILSLVTVLAWGLWLVPSQNVPFASERVRTVYVALGNLILTALIFIFQGDVFLGGLDLVAALGAGVFWTISSWAAFAATKKIGLARAMGIWAPLNILTACGLGALFFGEFREMEVLRAFLLFVAIALVMFGISHIIRSRASNSSATSESSTGFVLAIIAGVLWGSYFLPIQLLDIDASLAIFPMSIGILVGAIIGLHGQLQSLKLPVCMDVVRSLFSGLLWGLGNYSSLALMEAIGTGKGFTIAQLCIVVNALAGIYLLRDPSPGTTAAHKVLIGVTIAAFGGILLGSLRF